MPTITQDNRPLAVTTPLGKDALILIGVSGTESLSHLFHYQLDLQALNDTAVPFDKLLGQSITVELELAGSDASREKKRLINGICYRVSQGERDEFTSYRMELVPQLWVLSKRAQSRTFQQMTVPDILKKVLEGLKVDFKLQGTFEPRDYCVQYRETDFNFVSRLMEEEGIYYYFQHAADGHSMVVANTPDGHASVPDPASVQYKDDEAKPGADGIVYDWEKTQELRSGKVTLWDHTFEKPHQHNEATQPIQPTVAFGAVTHKLNLDGTDALLIRDYPGEYAQRFDGVPPGGGDRAADIAKIASDATRTVKIRMQEETVPALQAQGSSNCANFTAGCKFTLKTISASLESEFQADGDYVLTSVQHVARLAGGLTSGSGGSYHYHNSFTCIPAALPYRPQRVTPKPVVHGTQTAVVVGPSGAEIFTDKYSRIKVQFHWDAAGTNDAGSSCWCRVGTPWAGKQWGMIHIPRIGQEVIVAFEEGDPDRPIVVGSVYNAEMMPPYALPDNMTQSGLKTRSTLKGTTDNFNEFRFEDKKDSEEIYLHAEKDFNRVVENNDTLKVGSDKAPDGSQTTEVYKDRTETVKTGNETLTVEKGNRVVTITKGDESLEVGEGKRTVTVKQGDDIHEITQGKRQVTLGQGDDSLEVKMGNQTLKLGMGNQTIKLDLGMSSMEAMQSIELKVGQSSIKVDQMGVTISGMMIKIEGQVQTELKGLMCQVSADAMLQAKGAITMIG
jgi:type VI secretion system secreted protein VgrG